MQRTGETIPTAIEQKRDIRFWHDAVRMTLSPYILGLTADGDATVAGVTSDGHCLSLKTSEMVGVEIVPRRRHPLVFWSAESFDETLAATPRSA